MFDQVVFAGGGNRYWWQAGFWEVVQPELALKPRVIAGISAGAATACMLYTRNSQWVMRYYENVLCGNTKNAYWGNLLRRGASVFPHYRIYRQALLDIYGESFAQLASAPEIRIGVSHIPRWLGAHVSVAAGLIAYNIEKHVRKTLHPTLGRTLGFRPEARAEPTRAPFAQRRLTTDNASGLATLETSPSSNARMFLKAALK